jgi:hypothetical protein
MKNSDLISKNCLFVCCCSLCGKNPECGSLVGHREPPPPPPQEVRRKEERSWGKEEDSTTTGKIIYSSHCGVDEIPATSNSVVVLLLHHHHHHHHHPPLLVLFLNKCPQVVCVVCCPTLGIHWLFQSWAGTCLGGSEPSAPVSNNPQFQLVRHKHSTS